MRFSRAFSIAILVLALACPAAMAGQGSLAGLLEAADASFDQRSQPGKIQQSIELYRNAHRARPDSLDAALKLCRALFWLGDHTKDEKEAMGLFREAEKVSAAMVSHYPHNVAGWFVRGSCRILIFSLDHSLSLLNQGKEDLQKALDMDASFEGGGAHRVLGRLYFRLPWLLGGDNKKAAKHLKKALAMGPNQYNNHFFLAEVLVPQGKKDEARRLLQQLLAAKSAPKLEPDLSDLKKRATSLLKDLGQARESASRETPGA